MSLNIQYIIAATRIEPVFLTTVLELCFCIGNIIASTSPIIAAMPSPTPEMAVCSLCILGIAIVSTLGSEKESGPGKSLDDPLIEQLTMISMISYDYMSSMISNNDD